MVMPRARSSGALSIESKERNSASPLSASTLVIAAVSVVFPWSTCPIVPTFTCGFVRSYFCFAIVRTSLIRSPRGCGAARPGWLLVSVGSTLRLGHDLLGHGLGQRFVSRELHRIDRAALRDRAHT